MSEKNYVINVKTKGGTIITVRGDTADELKSNIDSFLFGNVAEVVSALETEATGQSSMSPEAIATSLGATVTSAQPAAFTPVPPPAAAQPAVANTRQCKHGPMIPRKGTGQKGEWKGYFCPTLKEDPSKCDPTWLNRKDPDWNLV